MPLPLGHPHANTGIGHGNAVGVSAMTGISCASSLPCCRCPSAQTGTWEASSGKSRPGSGSLPFNVQRVAASTCPADKVSYDLNGPWVSGNVGGTLVVQRTLTAVLPATGRVRFTASTSTSPGSSFSISVSPQAVTLADGDSATVTIKVSATDGTPLDNYQFGQVRQRGKVYLSLRLPGWWWRGGGGSGD